MVGSLAQGLTESFLRNKDLASISFMRGMREETRLSYRQLQEGTHRILSLLAGAGLKKGQRVVVLLQKSLLTVVLHLAIQRMGAVSVPLNPNLTGHEMAYFLRDADPSLVILEEKQKGSPSLKGFTGQVLFFDTDVPYQEQGIEGLPSTQEVSEPTLGPDDPAMIIYTSGTTGRPKGAILTHGNILNDLRNIIAAWEISKTDLICHALPLFHVHGLNFALLTCLMAGASIIMMDRFDPANALLILEGRSLGKPTIFMGVPTMYTELLDLLEGRQIDLGHVRLWASGSAPLPVTEFSRIKELLKKEPVEREGMSETGMNFANPLHGLRKPGSVGLPMPGLSVRIVDPETLEDKGEGEVGEIWLKGPSITPGYFRRPDETKEAFRDGWFRTGDLGKKDQDGYYYITDRLKHIIISGGEKISPKEVEAVINKAEGVLESSVVGIPDRKWGEMVAAAVVLKEGLGQEEEAIKAHCKKYLSSLKCPKRVLFLDSLPRNTMGKVLKGQIRRLFLNP